MLTIFLDYFDFILNDFLEFLASFVKDGGYIKLLLYPKLTGPIAFVKIFALKAIKFASMHNFINNILFNKGIKQMFKYCMSIWNVTNLPSPRSH